MDLAVDILEVLSDGKYKLNEHELKSIVSKADNCDDFALISIIGPKYWGKTFLMNSLVTYLGSDDRRNWPKNLTIKCHNGFYNDRMSKNSVLQLWSKPFILEAKGKKTAVFLMDSSKIFNYREDIWSTKLTQEMSGLIFATSSTVIYNELYLSEKDITFITPMISKILKFFEMNSFGELFVLIRDWNYFEMTDNSFGLKGGQRFLKNQLINQKLYDYFEKIECFLMPTPGEAIDSLNVNFDVLEGDFIRNLSELVKHSLLNIDKMQVKRHPKADRFLKSQELVDLFRSYVNKLNENREHFDSVLTVEDFDNNVDQTFSDIDGRHKQMMEVTEETESIGRILVNDTKSLIQTPVFGQRNEDSFSNKALFQMGLGQTSKADQNEDNSNQQINNGVEVRQKCNQEDTDDNNGIESITRALQLIDIKSEDNITENEIQMSDTSEAPTSKRIEEKTDETKEIISKFVESIRELVEEYETTVRLRINSNDFNLENGFSLLHKNLNSKLIGRFEENFNQKKYNELKLEYKERLKQNIKSLKSELEIEANQLLKQMKDKLDKDLDDSVLIFENRIKNKMNDCFDCEFLKIQFNKIRNPSKDATIEAFRKKVKQMNKTNANVIRTYETELKKRVDIRGDECEKAWNAIKQYLTDWEKAFRSDRYFEDRDLKDKHSVFEEQNFKTGLKPWINKLMNKLYEEIKRQNSEIRDIEQQIVDHFEDTVISKFWNRFDAKLKTGLFNEIEVKAMFDHLLEYTINTVNSVCGYKTDKKTMIEKLRSEISEKFSQKWSNYAKIFVNCKNLMERARTESTDLYIDRMNEYVSDKSLIEAQEFETTSSFHKQKALEHNQRLLQSIKSHLNEENYNSILKENESQILTLITNKEKYISTKVTKIVTSLQNIEKSKEGNTSLSSVLSIHFGRHNLFAGVYDTDFRPVLNQLGTQMRPNCIAISDEILFGHNAKNFNQSFGEYIDQDFDIKSLLFRKRSDLTAEKLNSYPFEFSEKNNCLRVEVKNKISYELSIESLIALQVLDIKTDAEKQFRNTITSAVFTLPTNYSIREIKAFRDVATIAGLESVHILSEITAAAIGYSDHLKSQKAVNVLFVAINDYECDAAVCRINGNQIIYESYCFANLEEDPQKNRGFIKAFWDRFSWNDPDTQKIFWKSTKNLLNSLLKSSNLEKKDINDVVVLGETTIIPLIKLIIYNYFDRKDVIDCSHPEIIAKGSAIFSKSITENNLNSAFKLGEVPFHSLNCYIENSSGIKTKSEPLVIANTKLSHKKVIEWKKVSIKDFPLRITVVDDKSVLAQYEVNQLPQKYLEGQHNNWDFKVTLIAKNFGELEVSSKLNRDFLNLTLDTSLTPIRLGLSEEDLNKDKEFIEKITKPEPILSKETEETVAKNDVKLPKVDPKNQLIDLYLEIKKRFEKCSQMSRMKRKTIEGLLDSTDQLLTKTNTDEEAIVNQFEQLKNLNETCHF